MITRDLTPQAATWHELTQAVLAAVPEPMVVREIATRLLQLLAVTVQAPRQDQAGPADDATGWVVVDNGDGGIVIGPEAVVVVDGPLTSPHSLMWSAGRRQLQVSPADGADGELLVELIDAGVPLVHCSFPP